MILQKKQPLYQTAYITLSSKTLKIDHRKIVFKNDAGLLYLKMGAAPIN